MSAISFNFSLKHYESQEDFDSKMSQLCQVLENPKDYSLRLDQDKKTLIATEKNRNNPTQSTVKEGEIVEFCQLLLDKNILWINAETLQPLKKEWKKLEPGEFKQTAKKLIQTVESMIITNKLRDQSSSSSTAPLGLDVEPTQQKSDDTMQLVYLISSAGRRIPFDRKSLEPFPLLDTLIEASEKSIIKDSKKNTIDIDLSEAETGSLISTLASTEVIKQFQTYLNTQKLPMTAGSLEPLYRFAYYVGCDALMKDILLSSMRSRSLTPFLFDELISRPFDFSAKELGIIEEYLDHPEAWKELVFNLCQKAQPKDPIIKAQMEEWEKLYDESPSDKIKAQIMVHVGALLSKIEQENPKITDPIAQLFLSQCFLYGINLKEDLPRAFVYAKKSADKGNLLAQTFVGFHYNKGIGCVEENKEKAFSYFTRAAERGLARAQYRLGLFYDSQDNPRLAFRWMWKAAEQEYTAAQYQFGRYFELRIGLEEYPQRPFTAEDRDKLAFQWVKRAAEKGFPEAQITLGSYYKMGLGIKKDLAQTFYWFEQAAETGFPEAQAALGSCYAMELGVKKDLGKAFQCFKQAADQGLASAQCEVGLCYEKGMGVERDYKKAFAFYSAAAQQRDARGRYEVARCHENGIGVDKNLGLAQKLYRLAAAQGFEPAIQAVGRLS